MDLLNLMQLGEFRPSVHGLGDFEPNTTFVPSKPFLSDGSTYHADTIFAHYSCLSARSECIAEFP